MKKIVAILALGLASGLTATGAFAATACSGTSGNGTAVAGAADGTTFVRVGFTPKCSANVLLQYTDQQTNFAVAAGSSKGKSTFIGSTSGGGVTKDANCPTTGCTSSEVGTSLGNAEALASSS